MKYYIFRRKSLNNEYRRMIKISSWYLLRHSIISSVSCVLSGCFSDFWCDDRVERLINLICPIKREECTAKINHVLEWNGNAGTRSQGQKQESGESQVEARRNEYLITEVHECPQHVEVAEIAESLHRRAAEDLELPRTFNSHSKLKHFDRQCNKIPKPNPVSHHS